MLDIFIIASYEIEE